MKPYGMSRTEHDDLDCSGCSANGRPAGAYALRGPGGERRAFNSLRGGRKDAARRIHKRRERANGKAACGDRD